MNTKKKRLHLKKGIIATIPVLITIIILTIFFIVDKTRLSSQEVTINENIAGSNHITDITSKESEDSLVVSLINNVISNRKRENTIIYYAQKYHLDTAKTLEIAKDITDNFTSETYKNTNIIGPQSVIDSEQKFKNEEAGIVYYVRDLSRFPQKYGTTAKEIETGAEVERKKNVVNGSIVLKNGLTYEQFLGHICDLYDLDKNTVLAISYLESGYMKSYLATYKNNFGGQRSNAGWLEYQSPEAGIIGHVMTVRTLLINYGIDLNDPNGLRNLSAIYVNGNIKNPNESWVSKVSYLREQNKTKKLFLSE